MHVNKQIYARSLVSLWRIGIRGLLHRMSHDNAQHYVVELHSKRNVIHDITPLISKSRDLLMRIANPINRYQAPDADIRTEVLNDL